jgi:hypothetical protein
MIWKKISPYLYCKKRQHAEGKLRNTQKEDSHMKPKEEIGVEQPQVKNAKNCQQKVQRDKAGFFSRAFIGRMALLMLGF